LTYVVSFSVGEVTKTLSNPEPFDLNAGVITNVTVLASGKRSVQTSTETAIAPTFRCLTDTYTDISGLRALIGSSGTLSIDGTNYTKCYISSFVEKEWFPGTWEYTVSFAQDTTT